MEKAKASKSSALLCILEYRNTPVDGLASPAQLLMGRQLRSVLPATASQLQPKTINPQVVTARRQQRQAGQKKYYDRSSRPLPSLKIGDEVFVQLTPDGNWRPARVTAPATCELTMAACTVATGVSSENSQVRTRRSCLRWSNKRNPSHKPQPKDLDWTQTPPGTGDP
ncbi:hypothetical protein V1264_000580 [Littorina saxatilis]|uniref:Uncharacterized protein n=1 Tax=Littorina saxatilis TaxID=31220 RepID=A0AAN9GNP3_9CAEN